MSNGQEYVIDIPVNVHDRTQGIETAQRRIDYFTRDIRRIGTETRGAESALSGLANRATMAFGSITRSVNTLLAPLRAVGSAMTSFGGLLGMGAGFAGLVAMPVQLADNLETAKVGFETLFASAAKNTKGITDVQAYAVTKSEEFMKQIQNFAIKSPFKQSEIITQSQRLMNMGFEAEKIIPMIEKIGNVSAASGKGEMGIAMITKALGDMRMKGKVSAEEMLQLTEAGVKGWEYLSKGVGKSGEELRKMQEKGLIPVDKAIDYILDGMGEFEGMMDKISNRTFKGLVSQVSDIFEVNLFTSWGKGLQKGAREGLGTVLDYLNKNESKMKNLNVLLEDLGTRVSRKAYSGVKSLLDALDKTTNSDAFKNADLGGKIKIVWDDVFIKPFESWWGSNGRQWAAGIATRVGEGLGGFYKGILLAIVGGESQGGTAYVDAGITAGKSFLEGFLKGLDPTKIAEAVAKSLGKFAPGGEAPTTGSWATAGVTAFLFRKQIGKLAGKGITSLWGKMFGGGASAAAGATGAAEGMAGAAGATAGATRTAQSASRTAGEYEKWWASQNKLKMTTRESAIAQHQAEIRAGFNVAEKTPGKIATWWGKATDGLLKPVARATPLLEGAGKALSTVGKFAKGNALGLAIAGYEIATAQDKMKAIIKNIFAIGGGALGAIGGGGVGSFALGTAGYMAGSYAGEWLYDKLAPSFKKTADSTDVLKSKIDENIKAWDTLTPKLNAQKFITTDPTKNQQVWKAAGLELTDKEKNAATKTLIDAVHSGVIQMKEAREIAQKRGLKDPFSTEGIKTPEVVQAEKDGTIKSLREGQFSFKAAPKKRVVDDKTVKELSDAKNQIKRDLNTKPIRGGDVWTPYTGMSEETKKALKSMELEDYSPSTAYTKKGIPNQYKKDFITQSYEKAPSTESKKDLIEQSFDSAYARKQLLMKTDGSQYGVKNLGELDARVKMLDGTTANANASVNGFNTGTQTATGTVDGFKNGVAGANGTVQGLRSEAQKTTSATANFAGQIDIAKVSAAMASGELDIMTGTALLFSQDMGKATQSVFDFAKALDDNRPKPAPQPAPAHGGGTFGDSLLSFFGIKPYATGGMISTPHVGLVGEAGPEAIIPFGAGKRARGLELWEKTGRMLGVDMTPRTTTPVAITTATARQNNSSNGVKIELAVNIGAPNIQVNDVDAQAVVESLKDKYGEIAQAVVEELYSKLPPVFENIPLRA